MMKNDPTARPDSGSLRGRAEKRLGARSSDPKRAEADTATDAARQFHELQVHQIELEMQNAELQESRERMEALVEKYTDLYEFAPVGYFSLDEKGRVLQVNLTGASLLGWERGRLGQCLMLELVAPASRPVFKEFLEQVFGGTGKQVCEVSLVRGDGSTFWADLQSAVAVTQDATRWCRIAVSDVSALKRADELARTNAELQREIDRRLVVETSLRRSEEELNRLLEQSHQMGKQLRDLSHRLLRVQEEERNRISRELHDDIAQVLIGIQVHMQALVVGEPSSLDDFKKRLARTQRLVGESVERVQRFARDLRPAMLDDIGLVAALRTHIKTFSAETKIPVSFRASSGVDVLGKAERTVLFRVALSALSNVIQHARATRVKVSIRNVKGAIRLEVHDDGISFQADQAAPSDGRKRLGLLGMRERLTMVGGVLTIASAPGKGTTVRAELPLD